MSSYLLQKDLLDEVEKFTNESLHRKEDLSIIIDSYNQDNNVEDFENLSFIGKYVNGLFKVLNSSVKIPEVQSVEHIKKDLSENMEKVISYLKEITLMMNDDSKMKFENSYFKLSQNSLQNLQQLAEDLDNIKKYLNHLKRKNSN
jgi:hypothetical protein